MELSNSIAFVGDIHLQFNNPTSRIDNYFEAILNKILQIMKENKYIVSLGDLFSNPVLDIQGTMMFIELLKKYKEQGGTWIEIIGNHTIYNWQLNTINKTTLGLLHKLGLIKILDRSRQIENTLSKMEIEDWTIIPNLLNTPKEIIDAPTEKSILVGHCYYAFERDKKHSLEYEDLKEKGYKYCFLGHDHQNYKAKVIESTTLYRPGSLAREAAHPYNFDRKIIYYQLDLDTNEIRSIEVEAAEANEIFSLEVINKHNDTTPKYIYDMEELMKSFKQKKTVNISIKKMLEENKEIPDKVVNFIKDCYEACEIEFV